MKDFRDLRVWVGAHQLTLDVYAATQRFPPAERYGLTNQTRRASASIAANIAEGCGRGSNADFARYLQIGMGSACELEYHLLLARDLNLLASTDHVVLEDSLLKVKRMLAALLAKISAERELRRTATPAEC